MPGAQALPIARQCLRLCTVDAHVRRERLDRRGDAADEPAAADRDNDRVGLRALGENLEPDRALPRHDERVVKRRHHRRRAATSNRSDASHSTSSAPSARMAACLTAGAVSGMTMQACVPKRCAA